MHEDHVGHVIAQWRRELPELDRTAFAVVGRMTRLAVFLQGELESVFVEHDLAGGEFDVLAALRRTGPPYRLTPSELSRELIITSGGLTRRLHALQARGLISRVPDPDDARSTPVVLTTAGMRLVDDVLGHHVKNEERLISGLTEAEREQLVTLLRTFALSLGDTEPMDRPHAAPRPIPR